jgi:serine/threonine protein phosphatase PrpC
MELSFGLAERPLHGEDRALVVPGIGLFGVFDGLGGEGGGAEAAEIACLTVGASCQGTEPSLRALVNAITDAQYAVVGPGSGNGYTTATVCWIKERLMHWISLGDSRIHLQSRGGRLVMVSRDEGHGNIVDNYLGERWRWRGVQQRQSVAVAPGDRIVLVTDGVTGDWEPDLLSEGDLEQAVAGLDARQAAQRLIEVARKSDDRTAIVVDLIDADARWHN